MLPKFSIAARRFTITRRRAMLRAPWARFTLMIAGSSWGVRPTPRARANRKESTTGRFNSTLKAKISAIRIRVTSTSRLPNRRTPRSNSVSGLRSRRRSAMAP